MDNNSKFDERFKVLEKREATPHMKVWPKVLAEIQPEPQRKPRFIWLSLLGMLILAVGTLAGNAMLKDTEPSTKSISRESAIAQVSTSQKSTVKSNTQIIAVVDEIKDASLDDAMSSKNLVSSVNTTNSSTNSLGGASAISKRIPLTKHLVNKLNESTNPFSKRKEIAITQSENNYPLLKANRKTTKQKIQNDSQKGYSEELKLPTKNQQKATLPNTLTPQKNNVPRINPDKECAGSRVIKVPTSFFVDAYVAPVIGNTYFSANEVEGKIYARLRDSTERNGVGVMTGIRLGYIHSSGLNVRAGIAYQKVNTIFKYSIEEDEKMIVTTIRDDQGDIIGRDTTFEFGRRDLRIINSYKTVDIPISLGYISMKNKVQIGLHAGAVLNLSFDQKGTYLSGKNEVSTFSNKKIFNKSIGASFFGSVELQYLLSTQWGVFVEPQLRFYPNNMLINNYSIKQNLTTFNIQTGLRYIF